MSHRFLVFGSVLVREAAENGNNSYRFRLRAKLLLAIARCSVQTLATSMTATTSRFTAARVAVARRCLERARAHLDVAMGTLPDREGDDTTVPPALLALLLDAVAARRHLADLEAVLAEQIEGTAQQLTSIARSRDRWP